MVPLFFLSFIANFFKTAVFTHYLPFFTFSAPKSICYFFTESTKNSHCLVTILLGFLAISDLGDSLFLNYSFFYQLHNITGREKKKIAHLIDQLHIVSLAAAYPLYNKVTCLLVIGLFSVSSTKEMFYEASFTHYYNYNATEKCLV